MMPSQNTGSDTRIEDPSVASTSQIEYCFTAEYTPRTIASATEKIVPQKSSWSVGHSARPITDDTGSWVRVLMPMSPRAKTALTH